MNIIWFNKFNMMPLMMPSWKNIAFSWFFRVFQALKGLAGVFDQHAARRSFWMWRPTLQTIFKHFKAHSRPKTMSYDVVRCHTMSTKRWECGPWKARFHQKRRQKRVAKCWKTAKLHPVHLRCRGSLPVRRKNMEKSFFWSCVLSPFVKFCKPSTSHMVVSKGSGLDM